MTTDAELDAMERWFVDRGLPHFVERRADTDVLDAWTRALPLLVVAYLLLGLQALDLRAWTLEENVATAALVIVIAVGTWGVSNRLRGRPTFARPVDIDAPELVLFFVGPTLPALLFGQLADAVETVVIAAAILTVIYLWSAYGGGPLTRWAFRKSRRQLGDLLSLVSRALPLLLLFNAFLFINAEVWEVAGTLDDLAFWLTVGTFFGLGATFAVTRVPGVIRDISTFRTWQEIDQLVADTPAASVRLPDTSYERERPSFRQRINIALLVLFGQALQITLVVVAIVGFFIGFGFIAISIETITGWTRVEDVSVLAEVTVTDDRWVLTEPLLRVAGFLGAFSGMYFTVVLTTDQTYRDEFEDEVGPEIETALAVRTAYRVARGRHPAVAGSSRPTDSDDGVA
ncbi:MAG: hypothetical protein AAGG08_02890 [Actinomycetota bacterium]